MTAIAMVRQTETPSRRIIRDLLLLAGVLSSMVYVGELNAVPYTEAGALSVPA